MDKAKVHDKQILQIGQENGFALGYVMSEIYFLLNQYSAKVVNDKTIPSKIENVYKISI